jgi:hypothetical protein
MIIVVGNLTKDDIQKAREDYSEYIKITIDVVKEVVAIGGEYHADAEEVLVKNYQSKNSDIWGGGYNIKLHKFETNAVLNIKPGVNDSTEIIDPKIRETFLSVAKKKLERIEDFL